MTDAYKAARALMEQWKTFGDGNILRLEEEMYKMEAVVMALRHARWHSTRSAEETTSTGPFKPTWTVRRTNDEAT
jgi:hypothetical protein